MNWQQLYTTSTPEERLELLHEMIRTIEARHNRVIIVLSGAERSRRIGWRILRERRRMQIAHFINDRRAERSRRAIYKLLFILAAPALTVGTWLIAAQTQPTYGLTIILIYNILLASVLFTKPYQWVAQRLIANR